MCNATMYASVLDVRRCSLLVCDLCTAQEVIVHTSEACCYCPGDRLCITYDGLMTMSIPPQITAICIRRIPACSCR